MSIQFNNENDGRILVVHLRGKLAKADYEHFVPEFKRPLRQRGKLGVLFDITGFRGREADALWDEIKYDANHFASIERLAVVGDKKWQHILAIFCKPFAKATIRYFDLADIAEARKWLNDSVAASANTKAERTLKLSVAHETGPLAMDRNPEIVNPAFHYQSKGTTHA
jgi:hypothetical protein